MRSTCKYELKGRGEGKERKRIEKKKEKEGKKIDE